VTSQVRRLRRAWHASTARQRLLDRLESNGRTTWPSEAGDERSGVAAVIVNWNTRLLIAQLVFSLCRVLRGDELRQIVVVDNGSTDGSVELLTALHDGGLIHLIANRRQRYHGPGLNQGISWLAQQPTRPARVWVLDSDVVILRPDALRDAVRVSNETGAALVGQDYGGEWRGQLGIYSLLMDPASVWQPGIPPFREHGEPSAALQRGASKAGLRSAEFPFADAGYLVHLGRGTLATLAREPHGGNRYLGWAMDRHEPHFAGVEDGERAYLAFRRAFDAEVPDVLPERLVDACRGEAPITLG
jgi:hypothetical protein